jgi:hypothetical protein
MRHLALFVCAALTAFTVAPPARAERLAGQRPDPVDGVAQCSYSSADVRRWSPADGPLASFVADAYLESSSLFVGLGYDRRGFWSAEADSGVDACDDCSTLRLVRTTFRGERESFVVGQGAEHEPGLTRDERRARIKQKIFAVAASSLVVGDLRHDYTLGLPKHDADGTIERFSGWFAEVKKKKDGALLRFAIVSEPHMCWCTPRWVGYTLAPPKKPPR